MSLHWNMAVIDEQLRPTAPSSVALIERRMRVLALDGDENACVASVRSLKCAGYRVVVGATRKLSKAGVSHYCDRTFVYTSPQKSSTAFAAEVATEAAREPGTLIIAHTESTTVALSMHRDLLLGSGARMVMPAPECLSCAIDKVQTTALAKSLGLAVPESHVMTGPEQAREAADSMRYPAVLKASRSAEIRANGTIARTARPQYACNADECVMAYRRLAQNCSSVLAQELVQGRGAGYFVLMNHGELRAEFAHVRVRDVHPTGSGSAVRLSVRPLPAVRDGALRILRALDYHGVAMVEFRITPENVPVFLEVNPRFWNSLALSIHAGVDFPALLAHMAEYGDVEPQSEYRIGVRCRWLVGDFGHFLQVLKGKPKGFPGDFPPRLPTLWAFLRPVPGTYHDLFSFRDPLPEAADWLHYFWKLINGLV